MSIRLATAAALLSAAALPAQTRPWATAPRTEQVDPRRMEAAEPVRNPGPFDRRIAGRWELWVPGGVWYSSDGRSVYRRYTPGAAINRLDVAADGSYRWAGRTGRLVEVRPWHAQQGVRYYQISHPSGGAYELYLCDEVAAETLCHGSRGKLVLLFGGVGGHAATGTRLSGGERVAPAPTQPAARPAAPAPTSARGSYRVGERVRVLWSGSWYDAVITRVGDGQYRVHYDGWGDTWDEWVKPERIRRPASE